MLQKSRIAIVLAFLLLIGAYVPINAQVKINEICAANGDLNYDPDFYNFSAWIELYNEGTTDIDLTGYTLTDNDAGPSSWTFPPNTFISAKGYLIVWCDQENVKLHTNFGLDSDGEEVTLYDQNGQVADQIIYPSQPIPNVSFGRLQDGAAVINFLVKPTPGTTNINHTGETVLENPAFTMKAGRYSAPIDLGMSHPLTGVTIRYTLDGSEPTETSSAYTGPIVVSSTKPVKAKAFKDGFLPSKTEVKTYFINEHEFTLKAISISVNPLYLNDDVIGIYVAGTNGIPGRGSDTPVNWNQPWWRHADIEFFERDGEKIFDKSIDLQISGNYSRLKPQKSFEVKARDKYGKSFFTEKLFPHKKHIEKVKGFLLRNSGTEWSVTHFRDDLTQFSTFKQLDVDWQDHEPYIIYLNGVYWGILNLREKTGENYIESNYNLAEGEFDMLEKEGRVVSGSDEKYEAYIDSLTKVVNLEDPSSISFLERNIDVQEFINYYITNIYYSSTDWPHNNVKYWAPKNGRFRWFLYDMDYSMNHGTKTSIPTYASLPVVTNPNHPRGKWVTENLVNTLRNPIFKRRFIGSMMTAMQTTFTPEKLHPLITHFQERIRPEMTYHMQRWEGSVDQWNKRVQQMRDFVDQRNAFLKQHFIDFFNVQNEVKLSVQITPENGGKFSLNGATHSASLNEGFYFQGLPIAMNTYPNSGYRFKHLRVKRRAHEDAVVIAPESDWRYFDLGTDPGQTWTAVSFDDSSWKTGQAELGYGEGNEKTKVSYGPSSSNKFPVAYFRKEFTIDREAVAEITGSVMFDDGAVVYLNGAEIARFNMADGVVDNTTLANDGAENLWKSFNVDKELLIDGRNVIAVSVHQNSVGSTDLSFDFKLRQHRLLEMEEFITTEKTLNDVAYSDYAVEAVFEQINGLVINEVSSSNSILKDEAGEAEDWIELYNSGIKAIDISGMYITDDLANKTKYKIVGGSGGATIQPDDYLILWADQELAEGPTHINFKLSSEGESIGLYVMEGNELLALDEVTLDAQPENYSWARVPNATGPMGLTLYTTPHAANYSILANEDISEDKVSLYPNPTTGTIRLRSKLPVESVEIIDMLGRTAFYRQLGTSNDVLEINSLEPGVYVVKLFSGKRTIFKRIVKK